MSFSLQDFDLAEMLRCGRAVRNAAQGAGSMEAAAETVVRYLFEECVDPATGDPECALVRFYTTHPHGGLPRELQRFAQRIAGAEDLSPDTSCLVLLATAGERPEWNFRHASARHQAIPLTSVEMIEQAPMIAQLILELGADIHAVVSPSTEPAEGVAGKSYNVFYVSEALGSPFIPAQDDFVRRSACAPWWGSGGSCSAERSTR
ncbi:MAG: hypothetical protein KY464_09560 [Gemmatimonadetes bacterium]|nr:hypothetical protein [Gemmatimonadota bacterium]